MIDRDSDSWNDLVRDLDDGIDDGESEWGERRGLQINETVVGWWRGQDTWEGGEYGPTSVYLLTDTGGIDFYLFGGRKQLDKRIDEASPNPGDRVAIRRLEDAPASGGRSGAWRVRVAVRAGDGTILAATGGAEGEDDVLF